MKTLIAKVSLKIDGKWFNPGDPFDVEDALADRLVLRGLAGSKEAEAVPASVTPQPEPILSLSEGTAVGGPTSDEENDDKQEVVEDEEASQDEPRGTPMDDLTSIPGVSKTLAQELIGAGINSRADLLNMKPAKALQIRGMTKKILDAAAKK